MLDGLENDLKSSIPLVSKDDRRLLEEHAGFVREMEQELSLAASGTSAMRRRELDPGVKEENDNIPRISKMQIDLMVNSSAAISRAWRHSNSPIRSATPKCAG